MTIINSQEDFLRALSENPEWKEAVRSQILGEELMKLPARFEAFVDEIRMFVKQTSLFIEQMQTFVEEQKQFNSEQKQFNSEQKQFNSEQRRINARVQDDLGALKGAALEARLHNNILNIAKDELNLTRGRILRGPHQHLDRQLQETIERAETQGLITPEDVDNLEVADFILRARRSTDHKYVYAVIEASQTIRQSDIYRARLRADTLASATSEETLAVTIGSSIHPEQLAYAKSCSVLTVIPAMATPAEEPTESEI